MLYQIIGRPDSREGCYGDEVLLGSVRIDSRNLVRTVDYSRVAFYTFSNHGDSSFPDSNCAMRGIFLVVTERKDECRDVLFFYEGKDTSRRRSKEKLWMYLWPSHHGRSQTGRVIYGGEAISELIAGL